MKKLILIAILIASCSTVFVSCTETNLDDEQTKTTAVDDGEIDDDDI